MASINISVTNEQVLLFVSCERRTCELRAGERREPGARENLSLSRLRRAPETSKNVGSLLTGENISLEITKWFFFYLCSFIDTDNWKPENMQERRLPAIFLPEQALLVKLFHFKPVYLLERKVRLQLCLTVVGGGRV